MDQRKRVKRIYLSPFWLSGKIPVRELGSNGLGLSIKRVSWLYVRMAQGSIHNGCPFG